MTTTLLEPPSSTKSPHTATRRVLLIAYSFPPVGGAGVQRPVKWVKYLERAGWNVTVLTVANPSVPVLDESLLAEIPAQTRVVRASTWEPGYAVKQSLGTAGSRTGRWWLAPIRWGKSVIKSLAKLCLQPDPQILWYPGAVAAGAKVLQAEPFDAIVCTGPAYTSFLVGRTLKRRFGVPLVLDYRDEWDLSSQYLEHAHKDRWSQWVQERQQRAVLSAADAVVATTQASVDRLGERLDALMSTAQRVCIYNGYDAEDFADFADHTPQVTPASAARFRLVYTGTLWNLTDVSPVVTAIEQVAVTQPDVLARLEFVCVGRKTPEQQAILRRLQQTQCTLTALDYCPHDRVLAWLSSADALCLLLSDVPGADRVVPAKLFEYLAARKPMLAVVPEGEAATIARRFHPESCFSPGDTEGLARWLMARLSDLAPAANDIHESEIAEYSREQQTHRLVALLEQLATHPAPRGA